MITGSSRSSSGSPSSSEHSEHEPEDHNDLESQRMASMARLKLVWDNIAARCAQQVDSDEDDEEINLEALTADSAAPKQQHFRERCWRTTRHEDALTSDGSGSSEEEEDEEEEESSLTEDGQDEVDAGRQCDDTQNQTLQTLLPTHSKRSIWSAAEDAFDLHDVDADSDSGLEDNLDFDDLLSNRTCVAAPQARAKQILEAHYRPKPRTPSNSNNPIQPTITCSPRKYRTSPASRPSSSSVYSATTQTKAPIPIPPVPSTSGSTTPTKPMFSHFKPPSFSPAPASPTLTPRQTIFKALLPSPPQSTSLPHYLSLDHLRLISPIRTCHKASKKVQASVIPISIVAAASANLPISSKRSQVSSNDYDSDIGSEEASPFKRPRMQQLQQFQHSPGKSLFENPERSRSDSSASDHTSIVSTPSVLSSSPSDYSSSSSSSSLSLRDPFAPLANLRKLAEPDSTSTSNLSLEDAAKSFMLAVRKQGTG